MPAHSRTTSSSIVCCGAESADAADQLETGDLLTSPLRDTRYQALLLRDPDVTGSCIVLLYSLKIALQIESEHAHAENWVINSLSQISLANIITLLSLVEFGLIVMVS